MLKLKSVLYPSLSSWALLQECCESSTDTKSGSKTNKPSKRLKVDELHGLGQRTGQFYIYNFEKKEEILLENTDQAFVLPIRDKSNNVTFQAIFAHKDGQWHIMKPDGSSQLQLGAANISAESKFVIENNVLDYDQ